MHDQTLILDLYTGYKYIIRQKSKVPSAALKKKKKIPFFPIHGKLMNT